MPLDRHVADADAHTLLDPVETERAARFVFERDRHAYILGHAALRRVLSRYLDIAPDRVGIVARENGKPYLPDTPTLRFNMSGSGALALIAVAREREVGVDVERVRPMADLDGVATLALSSAEHAHFARRDAADRLDFLIGAWTRKEAYLKARGEGLQRPLSRLECGALLGAPTDTINDADHPAAPARSTIRCWTPAPDYRAAVAMERPIAALRFKTI